MADTDMGRLLLFAGVAAGVLFFVVPTIEVFRRPAFDISRHAISMLSLGEGGWKMKSVFIVSGLLTFACAVGMFGALGRGWAGIAALLLIGAYGAGLVLAGIYDAPAGLGFPVGTPLDQQPVMTREATLHSIAFMVAFSGLILACLALGTHFLLEEQLALGVASIIVGLALPALIALGVSSVILPGIAFYWAGMLGWLWLGVTALHLAKAG